MNFKQILDHYQYPCYKARTGSAKNSCGDEVTIAYHNSYVWFGTGYSYAMAAASVMCQALNRDIAIAITTAQMLDLFGDVPENRIDCVLVACHALENLRRNS